MNTLPTVRLDILPGEYAICRLPASTPAPPVPPEVDLFSVSHTPHEVSVVCPEGLAPAGASCETGWRCFRVRGPLAFTVTGIVAGLTTPLAASGVPVFVLSTYDTDYLLVKQANLDTALRELQAAGHAVNVSPAGPEAGSERDHDPNSH